MTEFISTLEAAGLLGVHQTTIQRWIRSGQLKAKKLGPGRNSPYLISSNSFNKLAAHFSRSALSKKAAN